MSEVGTLALELAVLSWHTNMPVFLEKGDRITRGLSDLQVDKGLYPMYIHPVCATHTTNNNTHSTHVKPRASVTNVPTCELTLLCITGER